MKFIDVFNYFWTTYGMIREEDVLDNTKRMQADWQPHQGIEVLFQQIEEGVTFAVMADKFMDEATMIDSFLVVIKKTGQYNQYYEEWTLLDNRLKNWTNCIRVFWRGKFLLKKKTTTPAHEHGFGGNAEQQEADDAAYDATVDNFARGHAATQGTAQSMANTIQQQQQTITNMQQQINMANSMPFHQPMQFQQPMQYQQQRSQGHGRRDGGHGGRGVNWQQQAWGQMQQQYNTY